jgi:hypothetical protein
MIQKKAVSGSDTAKAVATGAMGDPPVADAGDRFESNPMQHLRASVVEFRSSATASARLGEVRNVAVTLRMPGYASLGRALPACR